MKKDRPFLRASGILLAAVLLGLTIYLIIDREPVPAKAQAQELFTLYFEMDHVRQESAQIFAELWTVIKEPERVGIEQAIGTKPALTSAEELIRRLEENQISVEETLSQIDENRFTDPEVDSRYDEVRNFYTALFAFEEMTLAAINDLERQPGLSTVLLEGTEWPALLEADARLREALTSLAALHGLEFTSIAYDELSRQKLVELDIPLVSDEVNTIVYPFTVHESATHQVVLNITFDIPLSDKIAISLEDPRGRMITSDQLAPYGHSMEMNQISYVARDGTTILIKLFPNDPLVAPIVGDWKLYVTAPVGSNMVIGMVEL